MKRILLKLTTLFLVNYSIVYGSELFLEDLKKYENANPYKDLKKSISKKDFRFISMIGYSKYIPGIKDYYEKYQKYGNKTIRGTGDVIYNYEYGRLITIAQYYASAYNRQLQRYIDQLESKKFSKNIKGYKTINKLFSIDSESRGNINFLPYSYHATLSSKSNKCVNLVWWFDPIENKKPLYNWQQFLQIYNKVNNTVCQYKWLQKWVDSGKNRNIEAQIFGIRPHTSTDSNFNSYVKVAWKDANLSSEPYYEIILRENRNAKGTLYISKDTKNALITNKNKTKGEHWLDKIDFFYHPKAKNPEYIIVNKQGVWKKIINKE